LLEITDRISLKSKFIFGLIKVDEQSSTARPRASIFQSNLHCLALAAYVNVAEIDLAKHDAFWHNKASLIKDFWKCKIIIFQKSLFNY